MPPLCKGRGTAVGGGRAVGDGKVRSQIMSSCRFLCYIKNAITLMFDMA